MADFFADNNNNGSTFGSGGADFGGVVGSTGFGGSEFPASTTTTDFAWAQPTDIPAAAPASISFDGMSAPEFTPTFYTNDEVPVAATLPHLTSEPISFEAPVVTPSSPSTPFSGSTSFITSDSSPVASTTSSSTYLSGGGSGGGGLATQAPSPYLSGNSPFHESSDFIRQYEEQLERRREEQANKEARAKEEAEARARDELARFYDERKKKADTSRRAHRDAAASVEDRIPENDSAAWANVGRLVDTSQTTKKEGRDVSRFKEVLVSLRH